MAVVLEGVDAARRLVERSRSAAAFTGAGISTASGVPDFRSPGGIWSRYRPVTIQEFVASADARRRYWAYKKEAFTAIAAARPNACHTALARWEQTGRLLGVITQNIDGLHQEAGSRQVVEVHGTNRRVECLTCGRSYPALEIHARLAAGCEVPECDACGGFLKPATISFGQALKSEVLDAAHRMARASDLMLVLGSSLVVHPAAGIPEAAADAGIPVLIVNAEPTPMDARAASVLHAQLEDVLPSLLA